MSSRRRSSRLGGANLDPIPSLDDVLVENRKRSRRASSASNTEIEDKSSTATISEATIAPIVEENVELHSKNKGENKIESKSEETPSVTLKRPRDEEEIVDESVKRAKIDLEKVEVEKCPDESPLPEAASELNISDSFSSDLENVEKVKRTEEPALTEANSEVKKSDIVSPDLKEVEEKKSPEEATLPETPSSKELKKSDSVKTDLEKVEAEKSPEPVLPEKPSEIKELLPPAALKRPREEENISLDSAKKAKLDISEETLEQNINPNSISTKTDTTNEDDDKKNQNVIKTKENNPGRESAEVSVKGRVCKSGRFWKSERDRFRSVIKSKGLKQNFKLEMKRKEDLKRVKAYEQSLKDSAKKEKEDLRARQEENKKKRDENQRKAEVYQEIKNPAKLKRMKKKQLRMVAKRDVLKM